jgi:tetratricopeptide (TPR) repeat protein
MRKFAGADEHGDGGRPQERAEPLPLRRLGRGVLAVAVLAAYLAGIGLGVLFSSVLDLPGGDFAHGRIDVPEVPADVTPQYRAFFDEAREAVADVAEKRPESPNTLCALGQLHYLAFDPKGEARCYERLLGVQPNNSLAYSRLVSLAQQQADYERIAALMQRALASEPGNARHLAMLGSALRHLGRFAEAQKALEESIRLDPSSAESLLVLGKVYEELRLYEDAERALEKAAVLAPKRTDALYSLAAVCAKSGQMEKAAEYRAQFEKLKAAQLESESAMGARAELADERFIPPRVSEILRYAARACLEGNDTQGGEKYLRRSAEISPDDADARQNLCTYYESQGLWEEALQQMRELRRLQPDNLEHRKNEGALCVRLRRFEEAERIFRGICRLAPQSGLGFASLSELYLRWDRNLREARSLAQTAVVQEPTAQRWAILAAIAQRMGDLPAARAALKQAMALEPQNPSYRQVYEAVESKQ